MKTPSQAFLTTHTTRLGRTTVLVDVPAEMSHEGPIMTLADLERAELAAARLVLGQRPADIHSGEAFRFCRKAAGLRRAELAAALGVEERRVEFAERAGDVPGAWWDLLHLRVDTRLFELGAPLLRARVYEGP